MNLTESVKALHDGMCDGVRRASWQRGTFLELDDDVMLAFNCGSPYIPYACDFLADDYELVNPKPQKETVEVKRCILVNKRTGEELSHDYGVIYDGSIYDFVELKGTFHREIKPKVKRREKLKLSAIEEDNIRYRHQIPGPSSFGIFAEWEE